MEDKKPRANKQQMKRVLEANGRKLKAQRAFEIAKAHLCIAEQELFGIASDILSEMGYPSHWLLREDGAAQPPPTPTSEIPLPSDLATANGKAKAIEPA